VFDSALVESELAQRRRSAHLQIVSATATHRNVFAMMPAGLAAVASSDMT